MIFSDPSFSLGGLDPSGRAYKRTNGTIAACLLVFGTLQCAWALRIGSSQLLKDSLDWAYSVALYGIAAFVFGRGVRIERFSAFLIAIILAIAGFHTLYALWDEIHNPRPDDLFTLGFTTVSAVMVAYAVVGALWRFRDDPNPLIQATWLSSRTDAISTTLSGLGLFLLQLSPVRWPEPGLDVFPAGICFQATWGIMRAELRDERTRAP